MHRLLPLATALMLACTPSDDVSNFGGGDFDFQTIAVDDGCLDGAFDLLFMPEGTARDFGSPVFLPALEDLPSTYDITLAAPFTEMEVTVTGTETTRTVTGAENTDVEFDSDAYPGCLVDAVVDVDIVIDSADEIHGTATLTTGSFDEAYCPASPSLTSDPCDLVLTLQGTRR